MGQYFKLIILNDARKNASNKNKIFKFLHGACNGVGIGKLSEFSYIENWAVNAFLSELKTPRRIVCAGDYADNEYRSKVNLYELCENHGMEIDFDKVSNKVKNHTFRYIINEDKKVYLDLNENLELAKSENECVYHPLPILISEGNGLGMGDYKGVSMQYVGTWARDLIRVSGKKPSDKKYKKETYIFFENFKPVRKL